MLLWDKKWKIYLPDPLLFPPFYLLFPPLGQLEGHFSESWQLKPEEGVKGAYQPFNNKRQVR